MNGEAIAVPPQLAEERRHYHSPILVSLAGAGAAMAAGTVLFLFDPAQHSFYPVCYFHLTTGLNCPGCGMLRAMHQLLHGHVAEAAHLNLLLMVCLPFVVWLGARFATAWLRDRRAVFLIPPSWLWTFLVLSGVFTVLRNLPGFAWLAP